MSWIIRRHSVQQKQRLWEKNNIYYVSDGTSSSRLINRACTSLQSSDDFCRFIYWQQHEILDFFLWNRVTILVLKASKESGAEIVFFCNTTYYWLRFNTTIILLRVPIYQHSQTQLICFFNAVVGSDQTTVLRFWFRFCKILIGRWKHVTSHFAPPTSNHYREHKQKCLSGNTIYSKKKSLLWSLCISIYPLLHTSASIQKKIY